MSDTPKNVERPAREVVEEALTLTGMTLEELADRLDYKSLKRAVSGEIPLPPAKRNHIQDLVRLAQAYGPKNGKVEERPATIRIYDPSPRGRLKLAREAAGFSPEQLAKRVGAEASYIRGLEDGGSPITEKLAHKLARALSIDVEELLGGSDVPPEIDEGGMTGTFGAEPSVELPPGMRARMVPLLSHAQAGALHGTWIDEGYTYTGVTAPNLPRGARAFAVEIRGDSMVPKYYDGDLVIALWGLGPRQGEDVLACLESGEVMCKIYTAHDRGERVVLSSYNPAHPPITLARDELRWVYPIDGMYRKSRR